MTGTPDAEAALDEWDKTPEGHRMIERDSDVAQAAFLAGFAAAEGPWREHLAEQIEALETQELYGWDEAIARVLSIVRGTYE